MSIDGHIATAVCLLGHGHSMWIDGIRFGKVQVTEINALHHSVRRFVESLVGRAVGI